MIVELQIYITDLAGSCSVLVDQLQFDVKSGNTTKAPFGSEVSEVVWIGETDDSILYLNSSNEEIPGGVTLYTADLSGEFTP
jgi:hypothetical protein